MKLRLFSILFLVILILSLLFRISRVDFPLSYGFAWGDGTRDFLVANRILKYREFPLLGPFNLLYESGIRSSPLYFYLLALILIPFNHILTLAAVNILLQLLVIILIYVISKRLFNQTTALIAIALFSFNPEVLHHSDFIWQPNLMQPFMYLALLFLIQGYFSRSMACLAVSVALHSSAFPWLPIFLIKYRSKHYFPLMVLFGLLTVLYLPTILHSGLPSYLIDNHIYIRSISEYFANFISNMTIFLDAFNLGFPAITFLLIFLCFFYFFKIKDESTQKRWVLIMFILVLLPIIFASFFNKIRLHYLILSMGSFTIFTAKIITSLSRIFTESNPPIRLLNRFLPRSYSWHYIPIIILFLLFFKTFTFDLSFLRNTKTPFSNQKVMDEITFAIKDDLKDVERNFQIRSYATSGNTFYYPVLDTILLVQLEQRLGQKLAKVADNSPFNHIQIGGRKYLVVACHNFTTKNNTSECLKEFTRENPRYAILKALYRSYRISVYLAKVYE